MAKHLKQLPTVDQSLRPLTLQAPYDFVAGTRRKTVPSGIAAELLRLQGGKPSARRARAADASESDIAAQIEAQHEALARLFNAVIVRWNLDEYARLDNQAHSPAGQVTAADIGYMDGDLLAALVSALMPDTSAAEADAKK